MNLYWQYQNTILLWSTKIARITIKQYLSKQKRYRHSKLKNLKTRETKIANSIPSTASEYRNVELHCWHCPPQFFHAYVSTNFRVLAARVYSYSYFISISLYVPYSYPSSDNEPVESISGDVRPILAGQQRQGRGVRRDRSGSRCWRRRSSPISTYVR